MTYQQLQRKLTDRGRADAKAGLAPISSAPSYMRGYKFASAPMGMGRRKIRIQQQYRSLNGELIPTGRSFVYEVCAETATSRDGPRYTRLELEEMNYMVLEDPAIGI